MRCDPQLRSLRDKAIYKNTFLNDPRTEFFDLPPVKPYAKQLKAAGYDSVELLAQPRRPLRGPLAVAVPLEDTWEVLTRLAHLRQTLEPTLDVWAIEILHEMLSLGIIHETASIWLHGKDDARHDAAEKISKAILKRCKPGTDDANTLTTSHLEEWMKKEARQEA